MIHFIASATALSVGASKQLQYKQGIVAAFKKSYQNFQPLDEHALYGIVVYFPGKRFDPNLDADNISKPIWDSLRKLAYLDDKQIRLRTSAIVAPDDFGNTFEFDAEAVPAYLYDSIQRQTSRNEPTIFIRIGCLKSGMIKLSHESF